MKKICIIFFALMLCSIKAVEVFNFGVPGLTADGVSGSRFKAIDAKKPDLAVIMLGRDDMLNPGKRRTPEKFLQDYENMLKLFRRIRVPVVMVNILPVNGAYQADIQKSNGLLGQLAAKHNIPLVDIAGAVAAAGKNPPAEYLSKRHFTAADSEYLARMTAAVIKEKFPGAQKIVCIGGEEVHGYRLAGAGTSTGETFPAKLKLRLNGITPASQMPQAGKPQAGRFCSRAKWLWYPENFLEKRNVTKVFRKTFTLAEIPLKADFIASGDDRASVYINGEKISSGNWKRGCRGDGAKFLRKGKNAIAVEVLNVAVDGGMIFRMDMVFADGKKQEIVSDGSWKSFNPSTGCTGADFPEFDGEEPWIIGDAGAFPWSTIAGFDYRQFLADDELAVLAEQRKSDEAKFSALRRQLAAEPKRKYQVKYVNSRSGISDGKEFFPALIYHTSNFALPDYRTINYLTTMRDAGYRLYYIALDIEKLWNADGSFDFEFAENQLLTLLSVVPDARIIVGFGMNPPQWYVDQNIPETVGYARKGTAPVFSAKDQSRALRISYASKKWHKDSTELLSKIIAFLEKAPYAGRICGYAPHYGVYNTEWHYFGMRDDMPDNGKAMTAEFRDFLRKIYNNDVNALQKAWKRNDVTFETAEVPGESARIRRPHGALRVRSDDPAVMDYLLCHQKVIADTLLTFDRAAKDACSRRALVGNYFGYILEMNFPTEGGHLENLRVLESPDVDFQISPYGYGDFRVFGANAVARTMTTAYRLRNKLLIYEDDTRTHLNTVTGGHYAYTPEESAAVMMRGFNFAQTDGCGIWILDFNRGWLEDPLLRKMLKTMQSVRSGNMPGGSIAQVAMVADIDSVIYHTYSDAKVPTLNKSMLDWTALELGQCAVPYDSLWMDDLGKAGLPDYKVYIFCNVLKFTPERAALIKKLRDQGKVLLWLYAPGIINNGEISIDCVEKLTGFKVKMLDSRSDAVTVIPAGKLPGITQAHSMVPHHRFKLHDVPFTVVNDPAAEILGKADVGGRKHDVLAMKKHGNGFSVLHTVPRWNKTVFYGILKLAQVHTYFDKPYAGDVIFADSSYLSVHSASGGKRVIRLPRKGKVKMLFPEEKIVSATAVDSFETVLGAKSTALWQIE